MPATAFCGCVGLSFTGLGALLLEDVLKAWNLACRANAASLGNKIHQHKMRNKHNLQILKKKLRNN
jgi:hypothetical protein